MWNVPINTATAVNPYHATVVNIPNQVSVILRHLHTKVPRHIALDSAANNADLDLQYFPKPDVCLVGQELTAS